MIRRIVLVVGAVLLVFVALGAPARAGDYPPPPGISIDKPEVDPGEQVTVTGDGCEAGVEVTIMLGDTEVATATTADDGTFSATFDVPAGTAPGTYSVDAINCTVEVLSTTLTVRAAGAAPTTAAATTLPRTGSDTTESLVRVGVVLLACGGLLVFAARRRAAAASR